MPVSYQTKQAMTAPMKQFFGWRQKRFSLLFGCIVACMLLLEPVAGQGEDTAYVPPYDPKNEYLDAIDLIEADFGPYATELSDLYLGLGQTLVENGDFELARDAFHRGVMVVRVNSGPNSPDQTNHLYLIANIELILGDMDAADDILHNIYLINTTYYDENAPELLPVLERIYQWYYLTRPPGLDDTDLVDYERSIDLAEQMAQINEVTKGLGHPDTAAAYRRLGETEFHTYRYLTNPNDETLRLLGSEATDWSNDSSPRKHYSAGRKAYDKYLETVLANESYTPLDQAEALANFADWCMSFGKNNTAREFYGQAYQVLAQSEKYAEYADSYMGQPKPAQFFIPHTGFLEEVPPELTGVNLDVSLTVTNYGDVRSVEVLNPPEGLSEDNLWRIKKYVLNIPFRPAMKEGKVVTTRDFIWQYAIIPQEEEAS